MGVRTGDYDERVALEPWHYGGPEHVNHVPHVAVVDGDGLLVDVEDGLGAHVALGEPWHETGGADRLPRLESVAVSARSPLRAVLVHPAAGRASGTVRVRTLGCMELDEDDTCGRWLGQRTGDLLKFLVCRRYRVVHAQDIAEALWGHGGFVSSGTVRQCVHDLREKLDAGRVDTSAQLVLTRQSGYALSHAAVVDADVHRRLLEVLLAQGRHSHAARCYDAFCARLLRDFGRPPGFTLAEL